MTEQNAHDDERDTADLATRRTWSPTIRQTWQSMIRRIRPSVIRRIWLPLMPHALRRPLGS